MSHEEEDTCHLSVRLSTCLRAKAHQPASVDRYKHRHGQKADMRTYHTDMRATPLDLKKNTKNTEEHRIAGLSLNSSLTFCEVLCDHPPSPRSPPPPPMLTPFCRFALPPSPSICLLPDCSWCERCLQQHLAQARRRASAVSQHHYGNHSPEWIGRSKTRDLCSKGSDCSTPHQPALHDHGRAHAARLSHAYWCNS